MNDTPNKRRGIPGGAASLADKRFRRPDVRPGRSRRFSRRLIRTVGIGLVLVALLAFGAFLATRVVGARVLAIDNVTVHGNRRLSISEIGLLIDSVRGQSLLLVDLQQFRASLLVSPWVASVTVRRVLPSTLEVRIVEREPVAIARVGQQLFLVEGTGVIIDAYGPKHADLDLPIVDGMASSDANGGPVIDPSRAQLMSRFLGSLAERPELRRSVSQVDVSRDGNVAVLLDGDSTLLYLGNDQFVERLRTYLEIRPTLAERMHDVDYVDLRFGQRVIAKDRTVPTHRQ
ncbi:MAG: FtsQ-type POTRA domain-containing protein [Vicinamibacterales bacterium]